MWSVHEETEPTAKEDYHCEAWDWIDNEFGSNRSYFDSDYDYEIVKKAIEEECKILKGTKYIKILGKCDGRFVTFRARRDLHRICEKYDIYA